MKRNFLFMRIVSILMDMVGVILVIDSIMSFGIRTKNLYIGLGIFLFGLVLWAFLGIAEDVNRLANGISKGNTGNDEP